MERRDFLRGALAGVGVLASPKLLFADQQCGPVVPVATPVGMHGVRTCTAGISSISFKQAYQQAPEWCWAASISMVFDFYGHPVDQKRIVQETWGAVVNMPGQPGQILQDLNKSWTDDNGDKFQCVGDMASVNILSTISDLQQDHPLIIGALGHATVLTAVTSTVDVLTTQFTVQQVIVRDPWPTNGGRRLLSPMEWANLNFAARIRVS
jgi:hypothetical protein